MLSSLKLRNKKSSSQSGNQETNRKPQNKWSIDRALCPGVREKKEACREVMPEWKHQYEETEGTTRVVGVALVRSEQGLGITLRGGRFRGDLQPLTITQVKPGGAADREGSIKAGDRLLAVDGQPLTGVSLPEAQQMLGEGRPGAPTWLTVEYDVTVMSRLRTSGPLLVEIDSPDGKHDLGLGLIDSRGRVIIGRVGTASIAERCGALLPGDQILAVDEYRVDCSGISAQDVSRILDSFRGPILRIEILPVPSVSQRGSSFRTCPSPSLSGSSKRYYRTSPERGSYEDRAPLRLCVADKRADLVIESGIVTLHRSQDRGFGLRLRWVPSKTSSVVCDIESDSVADRSGVLQIGDRVRSVNGASPEGCDALESLGAASVVLAVQFDVERHVDIDATVSVRLTRSSNSGFGITINGSADYPGIIVVSNIRWGSVAHRSGRLSVGDQLIAINERHIGGDIHLATEILQQCGRLVSFVVVKQGANLDLGYSSPGLPSVDSAMESWDSQEQQRICEEGGWRGGEQSCSSIATQHSDNETCSSFRLSESILDALETGEEGRRVKKPPSPPCPLQTDYKTRNVNMPGHWRGSSINTTSVLNNLAALESELNLVASQNIAPKTFRTFRGLQRNDSPRSGVRQEERMESFQVTLYKDPIYEDFGFSVSDGLYEKGVFINRIRPGGPASQSRILRPYDRIVQVNETTTDDFDCCLTVPLVASAGSAIVLTVSRHVDARHIDIKNENIPWVEQADPEQIDCAATL